MNTRITSTSARIVAIGLLLVGAAACGSDAGADVNDSGPDTGAAAGACPVDDPDCYETGAEPGEAPADPSADFDTETATSAARALLGVAESDLPAGVRVGRRGDEYMALTEDYRLGRLTVDLDDQGGGFVVTSVTVELPEGPAVITSDSD